MSDEIDRLRNALEEAEKVLALMEHRPVPDPLYHSEVVLLGNRIGFGAMMACAERGWRDYLANAGYPAGGEHVAGPCRATVDKCLKMVRTALKTGNTTTGNSKDVTE